MPLFSDPTAPPGWLETGRLLGRYAHLFLSLTGGTALAMALSASTSGVALPLALVAVGTSLMAQRAPRLTAAVEVMVLSATMALVRPVGQEWGWFGVACLLLSRASSTWRALRPPRMPPHSERWRVVPRGPMVFSEHDDPPR